MVKISVSILSRSATETGQDLHDQLLLELLASAGIDEEDIIEARTTLSENYVVLNEKGSRKLARYFLST